MLIGKKITVLGAGRSGKAAATLARRYGAMVSLYDQNVIEDFSIEGVEFFSEVSAEDGALVESDILIISPGIDTYGSLVESFSKKSKEVVGEVEFASRFYKGKIVGITGTNGKTTTTELIERILNRSGVTCIACGNHGTPLSEVVLLKEVPESIALELSSFQLETVKSLVVDVAIWLNFSSDHMDRYQSLEDYKRAKSRIFERMGTEGSVVIRAQENIETGVAVVRTFSSESKADYTIENSWIQKDGVNLVDMKQTGLRGNHNAENIMAAAAACYQLGIPYALISNALVGFKSLPHRCEFVTDIKGVEYLNDSKATNVHATLRAVESLSKPLILLAGGKDKGLEYESLQQVVAEKVSKMIVFGEIAEQLLNVFKDYTEVYKIQSLEEATTLAVKISTAGDTVLLSPATSSFDQFTSYEERGDFFKKIIKQLKENYE